MSNIRQEIEQYIIHIDLDTNVIRPERIRQMSASLTNFVMEAIDKYHKGQLEHGGELCDRNLARERRNELYDFLWYDIAETWKGQNNA